VKKNIKKDELNTILDFGCGEGTTTFFLSKELKGTNITGSDFSITGINYAKLNYKNDNLNFIHDETNNCLSKNYDLITAFEVLEHIEDWKTTLKSLTESSNKFLLLSFPTGRMRDFEVNVGHYRNFKKGEVELYLKSLNFHPVEVYYAGFPFYSPIYREVCNLTNAASNNLTKGKYTFKQKILSNLIYFSFRYLSTKKKNGDQFCGLFLKKQS